MSRVLTFVNKEVNMRLVRIGKAETTPQAEIELARRLKEQYCVAKRLRRLQILEEI